MITNVEAIDSYDRIRTALLPTTEGIKKFVLERTRMFGRPFSLKDHEYQEKILDLLSSPSIELVVQKPAQVGISEIAYRVNLANMRRIAGFSSAIVFPTVKMANEVMQTRIAQIISESEALSSILSRNVDSAAVKMFTNGSITYALGASASSTNANINRPIRHLIVDEFARADLDMVTSLASRQRHQDHQSTLYFSTPLLQESDIDAEMSNCGIIWEQMFACQHCEKQFFPDFWENVVLPGYNDALKYLTQEIIDAKELNIDLAYLCCPFCGKPTSFSHKQVTWVDTAEIKTRPKVGVKLSAFSLPRYVTVPKMVRSLISYTDRAEFTQQVLGKPAEYSDTSINVEQLKFVTDEPGSMNVMGIDVGNICTISVGSIVTDGLYSHTNVSVPIKDIDREIAYLVAKFRIISIVIDYLPNTVLSVKVSNSYPNARVARYVDQETPEMLKLKDSMSEGVGAYHEVTINKHPFFDHMATQMLEGRMFFRWDENKETIKAHIQAMQRIRDRSKQGIKYTWVKPRGSKTIDHYFHSNIYMLAASNLINESGMVTLPGGTMIKSFKLRSEI